MSAPATTAPPPAPAGPAEPPPLPRAAGLRVLDALGSLKLAVVLLLILAALTWLGTLAQVGRSIHDVQREYFESWFVLAELPLEWWGSKPIITGSDGNAFVLRIPLPGAYPVLALLTLNLLVGGMMRMRWNRRNGGVLVVHLGIVTLLAAGFVKLHYSYSGNLTIFETPREASGRVEGRAYESSRFVSFHDFELALLVDHGDTIEERVVPEQQLWGARDQGSVAVRGEGLPFTVQVHHWVDNAQVLPKGPMVQTRMPVVDGAYVETRLWRPGEEVKSEQEYAACYVTVHPDPDPQAEDKPARIEGILWGFPRLPFDERRYPFTFTVRGQRYGLDLRHVVYDLPFAVRLDRFVKEDHPGTRAPREFRSYVTVTEGEQQQQAQIFMNNPVRRDGFVAYQSGWGPQPMGGPPWYTGLEVSYNPSDVWPTIGCFVIAIGLLWHFLAKLSRFLRSSTRATLAGEGAQSR